jgi:hypothetical protein
MHTYHGLILHSLPSFPLTCSFTPGCTWTAHAYLCRSIFFHTVVWDPGGSDIWDPGGTLLWNASKTPATYCFFSWLFSRPHQIFRPQEGWGNAAQFITYHLQLSCFSHAFHHSLTLGTGHVHAEMAPLHLPCKKGARIQYRSADALRPDPLTKHLVGNKPASLGQAC